MFQSGCPYYTANNRNMIEFKLPIRMSELNGENKWVNLRKVMIGTWPIKWHHDIINFDG